MDTTTGSKLKELSLRARIKSYQKRAKEIEAYLSQKPDEWGKFQSEFNAELNNVFCDIMNFEKECMMRNEEDKVYKLKQIFVKRIRELFARGVCCEWSIRKPFGYAGDFKIIDDIYKNNLTITGFDRLFDNYFQMSAISVAVRNRKEDFKRIIMNFIEEKAGKKINIMNLASGPARGVKELISRENFPNDSVTIDCYDNEQKAIEYAGHLLNHPRNVNFFKMNAVKMALRKNINSMVDKKYGIIYSTGLFDYFAKGIAIRLVANLKRLLMDGGKLLVASVRDKYSNPSVHFMEWAGDWNLVYRSDEEFRNIFIQAGFKKHQLKTLYEQQGIMQYIVATNGAEEE